MKWLRFEHRGRASFGQLDGESVVVFEGDMFGDKKPTDEIVPLSGIKWMTPSAPSKMIGLWNNFHAVAQKNGWAVPAEPLYFIKAANSYRAHGEAILAPIAYDGRVVYEGELAVVIGKIAAAVSPEKAPAYILGYTCANDLTAADLIGRDPNFPQWTRAKGFDTFGVFGPVIETDFNPAEGNLVTLINGRERQRYPFSDMIFSPAQLVSLISHDLTLYPGDVIMCGTSLGVLPLRPGQRVEVTIEGIGTLANEYQARATADHLAGPVSEQAISP
jgi:2-keto-4-pentenoate hydratase/2-oxohepta-3-ene-1,7-dioic acid hydratase in catechol pathway